MQNGVRPVKRLECSVASPAPSRRALARLTAHSGRARSARAGWDPFFISLLGLLVAAGVACAGCSIQKFAINKVGDALASGGGVYESDADIELVGDALPFSLKLIESLLAESPRHKGLLLAASKGFTSYAYLYVQSEADRAATHDLRRARELRERARKLYLRAHEYGRRALEIDHPEVLAELRAAPRAAAARFDSKADAALLYWTAASLGLAISSARTDAAMIARLPEVDALLERSLALDESWGDGLLHEFAIILSIARPGGPNYDAVEGHFERARELSRGRRAGLFVSYAESVAVKRQDRRQFHALLEEALAIDPDAFVQVRLSNVFAQRRARWLLSRADELILSDTEEEGER